MTDIALSVSRALGIAEAGVRATIGLLDGGATVPFISRYRKEATGSLDELQVRAIEGETRRRRQLEERRCAVRQAIAEAGAMTDAIAAALDRADSLADVEDIYAPFKPRRRTRATIARERGLEPLARIIMAGRTADCKSVARKFTGHQDVPDEDAAIAGASDIIAEWAADTPRLRNMVRNTYRRSGYVKVSVPKAKQSEFEASPYAAYAGFEKPLRRIASHQYLALRRAGSEGLLKLRFSLDEAGDTLDDLLCANFGPRQASDSCADIIDAAVVDASHRLLRPSVESEIASELKDEADRVAIDIFSQNLRQLLLAAPLRGHRILAIDPGFRTGCKVVALDEQGNLLADSVICPTPPRADIAGARRTVESLMSRYCLDTVAIGNGTASRETERFVRDISSVDRSKVFVVSEDGASVYSASDLARAEFPDKDVTVRGAVSIGRRLIDPLAELVKIDPKSIGVGQYQHDVDQTKLKESLDYTVMSCVNSVGVDVNTASAQLLAYISGIGPALAANIVTYRRENGAFRRRSDLRKVPRLGDKAFELCAGFLRIPSGTDVLDNTGIHPESYRVVDAMARQIGVSVADLPANSGLLDRINIPALVASGIVGEATARDIVAELRKPGRDPRQEDNSGAPVPSVDSFEDLAVGMTVDGKVTNITAFGAFVDLGIHENGLIHISQLSSRRVAAVSDVLHLGQHVTARIIDIDHQRRRISLSLKDV